MPPLMREPPGQPLLGLALVVEGRAVAVQRTQVEGRVLVVEGQSAMEEHPLVGEPPPVVEGHPLVGEPPPMEEHRLVGEGPPPVMEGHPLVGEGLPPMEEHPLVGEGRPPVMEEHRLVGEEPQPAMEEHRLAIPVAVLAPLPQRARKSKAQRDLFRVGLQFPA